MIAFTHCSVPMPRPARRRRRSRGGNTGPSASLESLLARGRSASLAAAAVILVALPLPTRAAEIRNAQAVRPHTRIHALLVATATAPAPLIDSDLQIPGWVLVSPGSLSQVEVAPAETEDEEPKELRARELFSPSPELELRVLKRLVVAMIVGGIIGVERRSAKSLAGIRTFSLVSLGAAIFMSTALIGFSTSDPVRASAAISTSVGFLGAGSLHQGRTYRRGMTTAAGIWLAAGMSPVRYLEA
jgi:MgtC family